MPDQLDGEASVAVVDQGTGEAQRPAAHDGGESQVAPRDVDHAHLHAAEGATAPNEGTANPEAPNAAGAPPVANEETKAGTGRGIQWAAPVRWPEVGDEDDFRVRTWRLPAISMAGAGECVLYRFPGGGDPQDNLRRWMGQFRGPDGSVESVQAEQAQRVIHGLPAWLVRAQGTYITQGPTMEGPEESFANYGLFGAVVIAEGDPVFTKCVGPFQLIAQESDAILAWVDSLLIQGN